MRRILIAFAHPDDESFGLGGLIAKYVDDGAEVYLICTTNGDAGTVSPEMLNGYNSISELRLSELACASQKLGFKEVFTFGYKDSGMMGAETNNDPQASWHVWNHHPDEMVERVVTVMRQIQPQVVITFNKYGGYGHPDHIAIQRATEKAFYLAGDESYQTDGLAPYQPQKLYYSNIPTFLIRIGIMWIKLQGKDPRRMGTNQDIDIQAVLDNAEPIHTRINIKDYLDIWDEANACHASQGGGRNSFIPRWLRKLMGAKQGLTRAYPAPLNHKVDESDLFQGVTLDE